ncbi:MAG: hypothetical protein QNJ42_05575 [Crocosphaera sp.]|nr:hypothetical protein [Crocosphaera sp.]
MKTVKYTPDPQKKVRLTKEQLNRLEKLSDEKIDYSDIPELDDDFWENAKIVPSHQTKV